MISYYVQFIISIDSFEKKMNNYSGLSDVTKIINKLVCNYNLYFSFFILSFIHLYIHLLFIYF